MAEVPTRQTVLDVLRRHLGEYVSGGTLSRELGVSRTAVWKQVEGLRVEGYAIEGSPRLGYRLTHLPDRVTPEEIAAGLDTVALGRTVRYHAAAASTNDLCKEEGRRGAAEGLLVIAEEQSGGRGRLGRSWHSPPGVGIWMSVLLRPTLPPYEMPRLTLVAAVAVAEACWGVAAAPVRVKWPNDLLLDQRKVCGILTEAEADFDRVNFAVVGVGLNVNQVAGDFPPVLTDAGSLRMHLGRTVPRARLVQAILRRLEDGYRELQSGAFDRVLARWRNFSATLGRQVIIRPVSPDQPPLTGRAEDVDDDGALLVRLPDGRLERVLGGEVSLRPAEEL